MAEYHPYDDVLKGFAILSKYGEQNLCAEHDVLYAGPFVIDLLSKMSDEDKKELENLGWYWSDEADSWGYFT